MRVEVGGFLGLIIFILCIWAIVQTIQSSASTGAKVFWTVIILIFPVVGLIIWYFAGPRPIRNRPMRR